MPIAPAISTSVFRGVSDADCLRQAEKETAEARMVGYEPLSQTWSDDAAGMRVLTIVYRYSAGPTFGPTGSAPAAAAARAATDPWARWRTFLAVTGAALFAIAGIDMIQLKSQTGNTVAELFDNYVGLFSLGMAALTLLIALAARRDPRPPG